MNALGHLSQIVYLSAFVTAVAGAIYTLRHGLAACAIQRRSRSLRQIVWPRLTDVPQIPALAAVVHRNKMRRGTTVMVASWLVLPASFGIGTWAGGWNLPVTVASTNIIKLWWANTWPQPSLDD